MSGRLPSTSRKRSHTASLIFRVANSRLFSGLLCAVTLTRSVRYTVKCLGQLTAFTAA